MYREDLRTEILTRQNWRELIQVRTIESEINLLDKYILLTSEDLLGAKICAHPTKYPQLTNMYIEIWHMLDPALI